VGLESSGKSYCLALPPHTCNTTQYVHCTYTYTLHMRHPTPPFTDGEEHIIETCLLGSVRCSLLESCSLHRTAMRTTPKARAPPYVVLLPLLGVTLLAGALLGARGSGDREHCHTRTSCCMARRHRPSSLLTM